MLRTDFLKYLSVRRVAAACEAWLRRRIGRSLPRRRRLLFIDSLLPLPWYGAGYSRAHAIVRALNDDGWQITCFSIDKNRVPMRVVRRDIPPAINVVRRGRATKIRRILFGATTTLGRFLIGRIFAYDVILVSRFSTITVTEEPLRWLKMANPKCKIVFDFEALPALGERSRQALGDGGTRADAEATIRAQIAAVAWVDAVTCNAASDAQALRRLGRPDATNISYLSATAPTTSDFANRRDFLFVGRLVDEGSPNVEGLVWFVRAVWPLIVAQLGTDIRLIVAGLATAPGIASLQSDAVRFLGMVPDLRGLYDQARVFVAANRVSFGVPIKVLEAAAHGVPVVTTAEVNAYLGWRDGVDIVCGEESAAFAQACVRLYQDANLWKTVRAEALKKSYPQDDRARLLELMNSLAT